MKTLIRLRMSDGAFSNVATHCTITVLSVQSYFTMIQPCWSNFCFMSLSILKPSLKLYSIPERTIWAETWENVPSSNMRPTKTQIGLRIHAVRLESSLSAWRNFGPLAIKNMPTEDSDQTVWMCRVIWIFAGRTYSKVRFLTLRLICVRAFTVCWKNITTSGMKITCLRSESLVSCPGPLFLFALVTRYTKPGQNVRYHFALTTERSPGNVLCTVVADDVSFFLFFIFLFFEQIRFGIPCESSSLSTCNVKPYQWRCIMYQT